MSVAAALPTVRAVTALAAYLADASHGLAVALAAIRSTLSLTTAALPDPAEIQSYLEQGPRATSFPSVQLEPVRAGSDLGANQRIYPVTVTVLATLPGATVTSGGIDHLRRAAWLYCDAVIACIQNRAPGEQGNTLANGGSGVGLGRVIRATVEDADVRWDDTDIGIAQAVIQIRIDIAEDY